jgi:predicted proteasome-type protease
MSSGPAVLAIQTSGEQAVARAVIQAIAPFKQKDGSYSLQNEFRFVLAGRA